MSRCPHCGEVGARTEGKIVTARGTEYRCRETGCRTVIFADQPASECNRPEER